MQPALSEQAPDSPAASTTDLGSCDGDRRLQSGRGQPSVRHGPSEFRLAMSWLCGVFRWPKLSSLKVSFGAARKHPAGRHEAGKGTLTEQARRLRSSVGPETSIEKLKLSLSLPQRPQPGDSPADPDQDLRAATWSSLRLLRCPRPGPSVHLAVDSEWREWTARRPPVAGAAPFRHCSPQARIPRPRESQF
jgi:hypothetical protein